MAEKFTNSEQRLISLGEEISWSQCEAGAHHLVTALIQISSKKEGKYENVRFGGKSVWASLKGKKRRAQQVNDYGLKVTCLGVRLTSKLMMVNIDGCLDRYRIVTELE